MAAGDGPRTLRDEMVSALLRQHNADILALAKRIRDLERLTEQAQDRRALLVALWREREAG